MAELPQEMSCFVLPNHCNGTSENGNVTYQSLSASVHANRTYCTLSKANRSASLSKLFDAVLLLVLKTGLLPVKAKEACNKGRLNLCKTRQIFPSFELL